MFRETVGNIWDQLGKVDAIIIPVSLYIDPQGKAKLGKGLGAQLCDCITDAESILGGKIREQGPYNLYVIGIINGTKIISFPIRPQTVIVCYGKTNIHPNIRKRYQVGDIVPGIYAMPDSGLFAHSANLLYDKIMSEGLGIVAMPKIGSSLLDWDNEVIPVIEKTKLRNCENILIVSEKESAPINETEIKNAVDDCLNCEENCFECEELTQSIFNPVYLLKSNIQQPIPEHVCNIMDNLINELFGTNDKNKNE